MNCPHHDDCVICYCDTEMAETRAEVQRLYNVMAAVASMPGRDWVTGQLALAEALGTGGEHLDFVLRQAEAAKEDG